jgi:hypothetical protein
LGERNRENEGQSKRSKRTNDEVAPSNGGGYQEGSVESVGAAPSDPDDDPRTAQAPQGSSGPADPNDGPSADVFASSEVVERDGRSRKTSA